MDVVFVGDPLEDRIAANLAHHAAADAMNARSNSAGLT